jgi:hydroxyacylglutathione hydrolase
MFFQQVKGRGDNFSYVLGDEESKEAMVVDPSFNNVEIIQVLQGRGLKLKFIVNTHGHRDHTAGNQELKERFGGKVVAYHVSSSSKDLGVGDGDTLSLGKIIVKVMYTPGHSPDSICLLADDMVLTGDTLFVGECGRTDFGGGDPVQMYHSLFDKLMKLDDETEVYPGHDYGPTPKSTIGHERKTNYTLEKRTLEEFVEFMRTP